MLRYLVAFAAAAVVFGGLDFLWLGTIAQKLYQQEIGGLLLEKPRMDAAIAFYVIYLVGLIFFAVRPGLEAGSLAKAVGYAAMFGFVAYATYDLTNLATLKGFSAKVVVADLAWGVVVSSAASTAAFLAARLVAR
jgi:uncharacterized membrane protein